MTVIAYKDGVLAVDSGAFNGDYQFFTDEKLRRLPDGSLFAGAGRLSVIERVAAWLEVGCPEDRRPEAPKEEADFGGLWLRRDGLWRIDADLYPYRNNRAPFAAEGSHCGFVCGALAAGLSAEEAVRLACRYGAWAREPVVTGRVDEQG